jgi:hypothetical protein
MAGPLPTFFIIGAAKCGTTSLHFYLDEHPEIAMSSFKEPEVLSEPARVEGRGGWEGLFAEGPEVRGESSTGYSRFPVEGNAAARMRDLFPDAKLIYLVRDPIERIISEYVHHLTHGQEHQTLGEALRDIEDPSNYYVCASRYGTQVANYLEHFDAANLLVLEQWALRHRRDATLREVFAFLGVDPDYWSPNYSVEFLNRQDFRPGERLQPLLRRTPLRRVWRRLPVRVRLPVTRALLRGWEAERPELDPDLRTRLTEHLLPEMDRLRALTGKPLEHLPGGVAHGSVPV